MTSHPIFTDTIRHVQLIWTLSQMSPLASTPTSHVYAAYKGDTQVVVKVLTEAGVSDEADGVAALRYFDGNGAVRLLAALGNAQLLEYAGSEDLIRWVREGRDVEATTVLAGVIGRLHATRPTGAPVGLTPLRDRFASLFARAAKRDLDGSLSIIVEGAKAAEALLDDPRDVRVLHGDIHHGNVLFNAARGWLAIDPKGLIGERTYDAANILCNPASLPTLVVYEGRFLSMAQILSAELSVDLGRLVAFAFAHACLSACWSVEDGGAPDLALRVATIASAYVTAA